MKLTAHGCGHGFPWAQAQVALENPRVACGIPYPVFTSAFVVDDPKRNICLVKDEWKKKETYHRPNDMQVPLVCLIWLDLFLLASGHEYWDIIW